MKKTWMLALLPAAMGVAGLCMGLQAVNAVCVALLVPACFSGAWLLSQRDRRLRVTALIFGFAATLCPLLGALLDTAQTVRYGLGWMAVSAAGFAPAIGGLFGLAANKLLAARSATPKAGHRRFFVLAFLFLLICWLPCFLALYPGVFAYDVKAQVVQGSLMPFNRHHPLVHTLWILALQKLPEVFRDPNAGAAANSILQSVLCAFAIAQACTTLRKAGSPAWTYLGMLVALAVLPASGVMAMSTTKDTLYGAALLWVCTQVFAGCFWPEKRTRKGYWLCTGVAVALALLLRNNMLYALLVAAVLGLAFAKRDGKRMLCMLLFGLALYVPADGLLNAALSPVKASTREMMSVPIQQMARVADRYPEWQQDEDFRCLFQGELSYSPSLADSAKFIFRREGETPLSQVVRLWTKMGIAHPWEYVDAYLFLSRGWWDITDISYASIYGGSYAGYLQLLVQSGEGVYRAPIVPALEGFYQWLLHENGYQRIPLLRWLMAPAAWVWLALSCLLIAWYGRRTDVLCVALILLGLWLTLLLGPCCIVRYAWPIQLGALLLPGMLLAKREENVNS